MTAEQAADMTDHCCHYQFLITFLLKIKNEIALEIRHSSIKIGFYYPRIVYNKVLLFFDATPDSRLKQNRWKKNIARGTTDPGYSI